MDMQSYIKAIKTNYTSKEEYYTLYFLLNHRRIHILVRHPI